MRIEKRLLKDLKPAEYNPRQATQKQQKHLTESLKKFGVVEPVIVNDNKDRKNIIVGGHFRVRELKKLGYEEIDCVILDLPLEDEKELNIRLNANTGGWDFDILANKFDEIKLNEWGLEVPSIDLEVETLETEGDNDVPEEPKTPITVKGDLYELGNHRLLCGDSTYLNDIEKLMNNKKADLGFNDPPYGMKKENEGVKNDNLNYDDLLEFNKKWIILQFTFLKDNGSFYCWGIDEPLMDIYSHIIKPLISSQKATFRNLITWDKGCGQGQLSEAFRMYAPADEKCLFIMCGVQGFNNNADNYFEGWEPIRDYLLQSRLAMGWDVPTMKKIVGHSDLSRDHWTSKSQFNMPTKEVYNKMKAEADRLRSKTNNDAFKKEYDELKKEYYGTRAYFDNMHDNNMNNVWHFERTANKEKEHTGGHATPKPISLCERGIKSSCPENGLVIDFFGGSGSTLIACEKTKRKCYTMELDEKYCDVIVKRYINFCKSNNINAIVKRNGVDCLDEFNIN